MARPTTDIEAGRSQLLDLVEEIIKARGGASITLSELAREANMSPSNLYRFFDSKEALFEAVAERWFAPKVRIMEEVEASTVPVEQKLYDFFARRFALMRSHWEQDPVLFQTYCELGQEHLEIVRGYIDLGDHYLAMIVAEAQDAGHFPGLTIDQTVSLINLMVQPFCNPAVMFDMMHSATEAKLQVIISTILSGLSSQSALPRAGGNVVEFTPHMHAAA